MYDDDTNKSPKEVDLTKLRFALYARRSTEDEGSQVNSIDDQIEICKRYANRLGLTIVGDPIREERSAKYPNNRPAFAKMLTDIKAGKFDAILAYHPDRLARNMLEAGQILDMLTPDKYGKPELIRTLAFPTVSFVNDTANRLTLAVLFSLATNFSEHLSEMVQRSADLNIEKGISVGTPKWGYNINPQTRHYEPNSDWELVRKGWEMILDGKTQKEVVEYWDKHGLKRFTKITRKNKVQREIRVTVKTAPTIFRDPFACGILCQKQDEKHLDEMYPEGFKALVTREEWDKVQAMLPENAKKRRLNDGRKPRDFLPFRSGFIKCGVCGKSMYLTPSKGSGGKYAYIACQNPSCTRKNKNVRLSAVLERMCKDLDSLKPDEKSYKEYSDIIDKHADNEVIEAREELLRIQARIGHLMKQRSELDLQVGAVAMLGDKAPKSTLDTLNKKISNIDEQLSGLEADKLEQDGIIKDPARVKLAKQEFLNLVKSLGDKMRAGDLVEKDQLARILFLNCILTDKNTLIYLCKPEFEGLLKTGKINSGARDWT